MFLKKLSLLFAIFSIIILILSSNCSPTIQCVNNISSVTLNPNKSTCSTRCDCNNQYYEGYCIKGICISYLRKNCLDVGSSEKCTPKFAFQKCKEGIHICRDSGLNVDKFGDCICQKSSEKRTHQEKIAEKNPTEKSALHEEFSSTNDAGTSDSSLIPDEPTMPDELVMPDEPFASEKPFGKDEIFVEEAFQEKEAPDTNSGICRNGETRPCFAPNGIGICRYGIQKCLNGRWKACQLAKPASKESCNGKDDDCDGKIDEKLHFCVTTIAGRPDFFRDGEAKQALFNRPSGIVMDSKGNIYLVDTFNHRIRKIDPSGMVMTIAGSTHGDKNGQAKNAQFQTPFDLAFDSQNQILYVADTFNHRIRKIDLKTQMVSTLAGSSAGHQDGAALQAQFNSPRGLALDLQKRRLYIADTGNHRIRVLDLKTQMVSTLAGSSVGNQDGAALQAQFNSPQGLALDVQKQLLYIADLNNHRVRKLDLKTLQVITVAGSKKGYNDGIGSLALFFLPSSVVLSHSKNELYVADYSNHRIRKIDLKTLRVTTIAGSKKGYKDDIVTQAQFNSPYDLAITPYGELYISDKFNHLIRKIDVQKKVTTIAGSERWKDGKGRMVRFDDPEGIALDGKGHLYVSDANHYRIRKIDLKTWQVTTLVGGLRSVKNGPLDKALLYRPLKMVADTKKDLLYFIDLHQIRKIDLRKKQVTTYAGSQRSGFKNGKALMAQFSSPQGLALDGQGNLYVADTGNHHIRKIDVGTNEVTTYAGSETKGFQEGLATSAQFDRPKGLAFDAQGNLYVADTGNHRIRKIFLKNNKLWVTTVAGSGKVGSQDGQANRASFNKPTALAFDSQGNLFIVDYGNHLIRKLQAGQVQTFAGYWNSSSPGQRRYGFKDAATLDALFRFPSDIAIDKNGTLYIADSNNNAIRRITQ